MTWARLDDTFAEHRKILALSDGAFRVHVAGICYCARLLTDGEIPNTVQRVIGWRPRDIVELVNLVLWEPTPAGYAIHDYLEYNPSRAEVLRERDARAAAGRLGGVRSGETRRSKTEASASGLLRSKTEASPLNPVPSRPVPSPSLQTTGLKEGTPPSVVPAPKKPKPARVPLSADVREELTAEFTTKGLDAVSERIDEALNHKAVDRVKNEPLYVRGWLRRDLKREQEHPPFDGRAAFAGTNGSHPQTFEERKAKYAGGAS